MNLHSPGLRRFAVLMLLILTAAAYWPALQAGFVNLDDQSYIYDNPMVRQGLSWTTLRYALTTLDTGYWHPLTWISYLLDVSLMGSGPRGFHVTNLLLHLINTLLLLAFFRRATGSFWRSWLVAALFAVHPLRVESVAWIAERKDVLSTALALLSLHAYLHYRRRPGVGRFALLGLIYALCLMAKPMYVTLPALLLLLDYWPIGAATTGPRDLTAWRWRVLEKLPLLLPAAAVSVAAVYAQKACGAAVDLQDFTLADRLANVTVSYARYLLFLVRFDGLTLFYPLSKGQWSPAAVAGSGALLLAITGVALSQARARPWVLVGWLWYLGLLLPVIGLMQVGRQAMADRYAYFSTVGIAVMLVWSLPAAWAARTPQRNVLAAATALVLLVLAGFAYRQCTYWHDSTAAWKHALAVNERNYLAHFNYADVLEKEGRVEEALTHLEASAELAPEKPNIHNRLGTLYAMRGRFEQAQACFERARAADPNDPPAYNNLGILADRSGRSDEALGLYRRALELQPTYFDARVNLGLALLKRKQADDAAEQFRAALRLQPEHPVAENHLGSALLAQGKPTEAAEHLQIAVRRNPNYVRAWVNLGDALKALQRPVDAAAAYREALRRDPANVSAQAGLQRVTLSP